MKLPWTLLVALTLSTAIAHAETSFHQAPSATKQLKNPIKPGDITAIRAGASLYVNNCSGCHGKDASGSGDVPSLIDGPAQAASEGELFWFINHGSPQNGMPAFNFATLADWQLVTFIKTLNQAPDLAATALLKATQVRPKETKAAPPPPPFTDFRYAQPGQIHKITIADLPAPAPESSVSNGPIIAERPANAWPKVPPGFKVQLYTTGLKNPRFLTTAPNGDIFVAESKAGRIRVFRGITADGKPKQEDFFALNLNLPYGIAFYPPGNNPKWIYIANTDSLIRYPYKLGEMRASDVPQTIITLPSASSGHWTRDIVFTPDGKKMLIAVGSGSNIDNPDTTPREKNRGDILEMNPDGSDMQIYAYGIRNAGGGIAFDPATGKLWCSVNERDGLGDNLVPDYITHVQPGGFYGWPWWYMGGHQDPRLPKTHPELKDKVITPDVLIQPHNATLEIAFYTGTQFPAAYRGDIFAAEHGSWNRSVRTGYELIRVPLHQTGQASGEYEDFMTGFVIDNNSVWGRPVGVTVASDGSLLVSDDGSNSIWRIVYVGK